MTRISREDGRLPNARGPALNQRMSLTAWADYWSSRNGLIDGTTTRFNIRRFDQSCTAQGTVIANILSWPLLVLKIARQLIGARISESLLESNYVVWV